MAMDHRPFSQLLFFPPSGPAEAAYDAGFRFGHVGTHTSRTMMLSELGTTLSNLTAEQWSTVVFRPNPSLQIEAFHFPVNDYLQAVFDGHDPEIPKRRNSYTAVYRNHDRVYRLTLSKPMFQILGALCDATPFGDALALADVGEQQVTAWFATWSGDGLFAEAVV